MRVAVAGLLIVAMTLGACEAARESRLNPANWFGDSTSGTGVEVRVAAAPQDPRPLVDQVTALEIARRPGGAIVLATGLPPTQGWWNTDLVAENGGEPVDGVLTYRFVLSPPISTQPAGTPQSREVTAAVHLSDVRLAGVREIVVLGTRSSRSSRR
ncbi:hypothetical protein OEZ60_20685 [Defluviimonas sp. WL0024]|uniref:Lipoprotein n=1 Tax=Albidovulum salinarum TaxID=2984153 RepID=A0ABT2XAG3_9RHOB|nr:hypothetical protein [Defluviimonas sp. WL0024]MCU9850404.1 hypothetical protein [Defluviimonas sp. WL0024]